MSSYPYKHKEGSLIYKVENYRFRFQGVSAAAIELMKVPGERFHFEYEIYKNDKYWSDLPSDLQYGVSNNNEILNEIGMESHHGTFETKEEALQKAIEMIEATLDKYRDKALFWADNKKG